MAKTGFKIIICGAGIAGLCAAIALAQLGHQIVILESAKKLSPVGVGIHIPPNATLVLRHWGILERFNGFVTKPRGFTFRRYDDSRILATTGSQAIGTDGSEKSNDPYWLMRRADYQRVLHEVAMELGCELHLGSRVLSVDEDGPAVILAENKRLTADLIIAADGIKSALRQQVIPEDDTSSLLQPLSTYRAWSPARQLLRDPEAAILFDSPTSNVWLGPNRHVIVYPTEGGSVLAINGTFPAHQSSTRGWNEATNREDIEKQFIAFDPIVRKILSEARDCKAWALAETPRLVRWISKTGHFALVGDAAHGMLQFLAQGAAMATEDAAALAQCIGRATSREQIPALMRVYERSRKWRCERVQAQARRNGYAIHIPDGQEQEVRDRKMAGKSLPTDDEVDCGPFFDDRFKTWLYGHDVIQHVSTLYLPDYFKCDTLTSSRDCKSLTRIWIRVTGPKIPVHKYSTVAWQDWWEDILPI